MSDLNQLWWIVTIVLHVPPPAEKHSAGGKVMQLIAFADASQVAYGAVVYFKTIRAENVQVDMVL